MINRTTPDELIAVGQTIVTSAARLEELLLALSKEADAQFAAASHAFIIQHAKPGPNRHIYAEYKGAFEEAVASAVAASNMRELAERGTTLRSKCAWWNLADRRQTIAEIRRLCELLPEWTANFPDEKPGT